MNTKDIIEKICQIPGVGKTQVAAVLNLNETTIYRKMYNNSLTMAELDKLCNAFYIGYQDLFCDQPSNTKEKVFQAIAQQVEILQKMQDMLEAAND